MKKKKITILLLLRKNDYSCKKFHKFILSKCKQTSVIWTDHNTQKKTLDKIKKKFDYIISYRNAIILRKKNIELANIAAINIHPGPPKYRGVGCLNYALYNNEKTYGFTIHLIEEKIDGGQILYVKNFLINKNSSVESLLDLTHKNCLKYSTIFFKSIFKDSRNLDIFKKNNKNIKWSKIIKSRKDLNNFYRLNKFDVKEVEKKIRATNYKNYKPFIKIKNYKFILE